MRHFPKAHFDDLLRRVPGGEIHAADHFFESRARSTDALPYQVLRNWNLEKFNLGDMEEPYVRSTNGQMLPVIPCSFSRRPGNTSHYEIQTAWYLLRAIFVYRLEDRAFWQSRLELDQAARILSERALFGNHEQYFSRLHYVGMFNAHDFFEHPYSLTGSYLPKICDRVATVTFGEKFVQRIDGQSPVIPIGKPTRTELYGCKGFGDRSRALAEIAHFLMRKASIGESNPIIRPSMNVDGEDGIIFSVSYVAREGVHQWCDLKHFLRKTFFVFIPRDLQQLLFGDPCFEVSQTLNLAEEFA